MFNHKCRIKSTFFSNRLFNCRTQTLFVNTCTLNSINQSQGTKTFSFGHCPKRGVGGGGRGPGPNFLALFHHVIVPYSHGLQASYLAFEDGVLQNRMTDNSLFIQGQLTKNTLDFYLRNSKFWYCPLLQFVDLQTRVAGFLQRPHCQRNWQIIVLWNFVCGDIIFIIFNHTCNCALKYQPQSYNKFMNHTLQTVHNDRACLSQLLKFT